MDIGALRADLATVLTALGWHAFAFVPDDPKTLPAALVHPPSAIDYGYSLTLSQLTLAVSLYVSTNNTQSAQALLDKALSTGIAGSVYDALRAHTPTAWKAIQVTGAGNVRLVDVGTAKAIAMDITLDLIA